MLVVLGRVSRTGGGVAAVLAARRLRGDGPATLSSVARGTAYEKHCLAELRRLGIVDDLVRVGGAGDAGIDGRGRLRRIDDVSPVTTVIVQCKSNTAALGPGALRELEGTLTRHEDGLGVLCAAAGFTPALCRSCLLSPRAVVLLQVPFPRPCEAAPPEATDGRAPNGVRVDSVLWSVGAGRLLTPLLSTKRRLDGDGGAHVVLWARQ